MSDERIFQEALSNFTFDFANGGSIRHLADLGYSVKEIVKKIEFHGDIQKIQKVVWDYYLQSGKILLEEPGSFEKREKITYIKETGKYGRRTFRKVVEKIDNSENHFLQKSFEDFLLENSDCDREAYAQCEFGKIKKETSELYEKMLGFLTERDREFMMGLLWEEKDVVYYKLDSRMIQILKELAKANIYHTDIWRR